MLHILALSTCNMRKCRLFIWRGSPVLSCAVTSRFCCNYILFAEIDQNRYNLFTTLHTHLAPFPPEPTSCFIAYCIFSPCTHTHPKKTGHKKKCHSSSLSLCPSPPVSLLALFLLIPFIIFLLLPLPFFRGSKG